VLDPIIAFDAIPAGAVLLDVRWTVDGGSDLAGFRSGHLPGARFVAFESVCAEPGPATAGRHPLASPDRFAAGLADVGVGNDAEVVVYDGGGMMAAARLVWMLRTIDQSAAILDGGLPAWPGRLETGDPGAVSRVARDAVPWPDGAVVDADVVAAVAAAGDRVVADCRAADRYRGVPHPLDTRSGHIPGAVSLPYAGSLDEWGRLLDLDLVRSRFREAGADAGTIYYCGSGVSACVSALVAEQVGIGRGRLYVASWSGWTADPDRPVETATPS
jgi:thiosulfate/3-mercaptopyruvate sulfurtransferase